MRRVDLLQEALKRFLEIIDPLAAAAEDPKFAEALIDALGLPPGIHVSAPLISVGAIQAIKDYTTSDDTTLEQFAEIVDDVIVIADAIRGFVEAARADAGEPVTQALVEEGVHQIIQLLTLNYLRRRYPRLHAIMRLLGVIDEQLSAYEAERIVPKHVAELVADPGNYFDKVFGKKLDTEDDALRLSDRILGPLTVLLAAIPHSWRYDTRTLYRWEPSPDSVTPIADRVSSRALAFRFAYRVSSVTADAEPTDFLDESTADEIVIFDENVIAHLGTTVAALLVPRVHGGPGLLLSIGLVADSVVPIEDEWKMVVNGSSDALMELFVPFDGSPARFLNNYPADFDVSYVFHRDAYPGDEKRFLLVLGEKKGIRLELGRIAVTIRCRIAKGDKPDFEIQFGSHDCVINLLPRDELNTLLQREDEHDVALPIPIDVNLGYSSVRGFYLEGAGSGFRFVVAQNKRLGPILLQFVVLEVVHDIKFERPWEFLLTATFAVTLGPLVITIDQFGLRALVPGIGHRKRWTEELRDRGIDDHLIDDVTRLLPDLAAKMPSGIGLAISTGGAIEGGGFLFFDTEKEEYAGVVQLRLFDRVNLTAIGLLTTRLPDGSSGFSLLVMITTEFSPPFPIAWGFTLNGVGGLLGIRRSVVVDVLRAGLRNRTLDAILFPQDAVRDAPQIISTLRSVFPPTLKRHVFGPIFMIGWGTPTMVTLQLGVIFEVETKTPTNWPLKRLLLLGQIDVRLPSEDLFSVVDLHMDALGVVDFTTDDISLDATLYKSQLFYYVVSGDMALRANFGDTPLFVLAVGGVHPKFKELPPAFPTLRPVSIGLADTSKFRLRLVAYTALTSNTAQFGARCEVYAKEGGFSIEGSVSFDALFYFRPFQFVADVGGRVAVRKGGHTLMSVGLDMSLTGPTPWHARGRATFNVLGFKHSVDFEKTFGHDAETPALESVDVAARLEEAIREGRNWTGVMPGAEQPQVVFKPARGQGVRVHPWSDLQFRQTVVPLGLSITKFGEMQPGTERRFALTVIRIDGDKASRQAETEHFAAAQFFELSDQDKLSRPSFERFEAGARMTSTTRAGQPMAVALTFETYLIDPEYGVVPQRIDDYAAPVEDVHEAARFGPASLSQFRRTGRQKYRNATTPIAVTDAVYTIGQKDDPDSADPLLPAPTRPLNHWYAVDALREAAASEPARLRHLQLVRR